MALIYLWLLLFLSVSADININHGDKENTKTNINTFDKTLYVNINAEDDGAWYGYKNENTDVKVTFRKPVVKSDEEKLVSNFLTRQQDGTFYRFQYYTSKETTREEDGELQQDGNLVVSGAYSYEGEDGVRYIIGYSADKNGYRAKVAFGPKVNISGFAFLSAGAPASAPARPPAKGIDGALLCSLAGGGCK